MQNGRKYHLSREGKPLGLFDENVVRELLRVGKLRPTDDYWTPGMTAWAKLSILPARRVQVQQARPAPTGVPSAGTAIKKPAMKKIAWRKLWPLPVLMLLAALIGYSASMGNDSNATPKRSKRQMPRQPSVTESTTEKYAFTKGFSPFQPMGKEIFPSHVIAFANTQLKPSEPAPGDAPHYGKQSYLAGVLIAAPKRGDKVTVEVSADRFMRKSSVAFTVDRESRYASAGPAPLFDFEALAKVRQTTPFNVTIKATRNDGEPVVFTEIWQAHQLNDCPNSFSVLRLTQDARIIQTRHHGGRTLAGFVNENHPMIEKILEEATGTGICAAFTGYAEGEDEVLRQIEAVWTTLKKRGITYSNTAESTYSPLHSFQHVRLLEQSLSSKQANCVDATVMLASVLKKIGLNVGIILVPKHAYLVVYDESGGRREFAIESTGIANATLNQAIKAATEEQDDNLRDIEEMLGEKDDPYHEVHLEDCRRSGVQPIPYVP